MKEYHNSLLSVQIILLSFKLVGDSQDENMRAKLANQIVTQLTSKQTASILTNDK